MGKLKTGALVPRLELDAGLRGLDGLVVLEELVQRCRQLEMVARVARVLPRRFLEAARGFEELRLLDELVPCGRRLV